MSMLIFYVGETRYALENRYILRVIPQVILQPMAHPSSNFIGLLNLGGSFLPVVDFCQVMEKRKAKSSFHTRIILIQEINKHYPSKRVMGLLGEKVLEILDLDEFQFVETQLYARDFPYLSKVFNDGKGMIHRIDISQFFQFFMTDLVKISTEKIDDGRKIIS
jgi:chemotaxis-related protein WspB